MRDCPPTCRGRRGPANRCSSGSAPSTVARELKRNGSRSGGYPVYAHEQARARRCSNADELRACVLERLSWGWSPEHRCRPPGRSGRADGVSYESIYRFIYARRPGTRTTPGGAICHGRSGSAAGAGEGSSSASFIAHRRPVAERPARRLSQRLRPWEADLMLFARSGPVLLVLQERRSRLLLMMRARSKAAGPIARPSPGCWAAPGISPDGYLRQWDRVRPPPRAPRLGIETFFCDTYSPWQKGGGERHRPAGRFLPRKMNLAEVPEERFTEVALAYNNTPRKCLGYRSSAEIFKTRVLHFKCEFTFPLSRE